MVLHSAKSGVYEEAFPTFKTSSSWEEIGKEIIEIHKKMLQEFVDRMPKDWGKRINNIVSDFQNRFREMGMGAGLMEGLRNRIFARLSMIGSFVSGGPLGALGSLPSALSAMLGVGVGTGAAGGADKPLTDMIAAVQNKLAPREGRFLTFAPGAKMDPVERNTREQVKLAKEQTNLARKLLGIGEKIMVSLSPAAVPPANAMTLRAARLYL